jgi:hypothetical protein
MSRRQGEKEFQYISVLWYYGREMFVGYVADGTVSKPTFMKIGSGIQII